MFNEEKSDSPNWQAICLTLQLVVREKGMGALLLQAPVVANAAVAVTGVTDAATILSLVSLCSMPVPCTLRDFRVNSDTLRTLTWKRKGKLSSGV